VTFSDNNSVILFDPVTNATQVTEMKNTLGQMNCISKDNTKCTIDNVFMTDEGEPNFGANLKLPENLAVNTTFYEQNFVSMKYRGSSQLIIDGNTDLEDLFGDDDKKTDDEKDNEHLFPDGDDGKYIDDEDDDSDRPFDKPWEILPNGNRRRLQDAAGNNSTSAEP